MDFYQRAQELMPDTVAFRRYLHMHPEESHHEVNTARAISALLTSYSIEHKVLDCNAVIATIRGAYPGRKVALRADTDALCCDDTCGTEYQSVNPGLCHACGHDVHTASLMTGLRMLQEKKNELHGEVMAIFQHSEEKPPSGARELLDQYRIMDGVDAIFGTHVVNFLNAGDVSVQAGPRLAGSMNFYVDVIGKGGHGAMPDACIDPVVASAAMIMNLQTIVSRETAPNDSVSLTVGQIHGGKSHHSIADSVHFEAAIKCMNVQIRERIRESVDRILKATAEVYRCKVEVRYTRFGKPLVNDAVLAQLAERSAAAQLGREHVVQCAPWTVSEDFTDYLDHAPGIFALVGGRNEERGLVLQNHHPAFDVDESCLASAAAVYAGFAYDYLNEN